MFVLVFCPVMCCGCLLGVNTNYLCDLSVCLQKQCINSWSPRERSCLTSNVEAGRLTFYGAALQLWLKEHSHNRSPLIPIDLIADQYHLSFLLCPCPHPPPPQLLPSGGGLRWTASATIMVLMHGWVLLYLHWNDRCITITVLGTGTQDGHLDFHTAPELCLHTGFSVALRPQNPYDLFWTGVQNGHLDFHTAPELCPNAD